MSLHPKLHAITERIVQRSAASRAAYLAGVDAALRDGPFRSRLSCGNLAHGFAACGPTDKSRLRGGVTPNLGIITAYNDMLSAHQPFEHYPEILRETARELTGGRWRAGDVRRGHPGPRWHGAVAVLARCDRPVDRDRPEP